MFKNDKAKFEILSKPEHNILASEREKTLTAIMSASAGSFDLDEIIKSIIEETGKLFGADRCFFIEFDPNTYSKQSMKNHTEYLSSKEIKSHLLRIPTKEETEYFSNKAKRREIIFVENLQEAGAEKTSGQISTDDSAVKSYLILPVLFGDTMYGSIVLHYVTTFMKFSEEDIEVAQALANQSAIVMHQSKLYNELKQTTAEQNSILNNIPFMAWTKDIGGNFLSVNKQFCENYELNIEDIIGKTDYLVSPVDFADKYREDDYKVIQSGQQKITEEKIMTESGIGWAETFKSPLLDGDGNIVGTVGFARDITEKKEAEIELLNKQEQIIKAAEREKTLRVIMSSAAGSFDMHEVIKSIIEETGKLFYADRCFFIEFDPDINANLPINNYAEYLSSKGIRSHLTRQPVYSEVENFLNVTKRKEVSFVEDTEKANLTEASRQMLIDDLSVKSYLILPVFFGDRMYGSLILHYVRDFKQFSEDDIEIAQAIANQSAIVIHQAKLYNELKKTTLKQNAILDNLPFLGWTKNISGQFIEVNNQFCEFFKIKAEDIIGKTEYMLYPFELAEKYRKDDCEVIKTRKQKITEEKMITEKGIGWAETFKSPFFDEEGKAIGTVGLARDITEKKEAELELLHRQEQIIKAAEKEALIANIISEATITFDISKIKQMVKKIGIIAKADRCYFVQADAFSERKGLPVDLDGEYIASDEIKSIREYDFPEEDIKVFVENLLNKKDLVVYDFECIKNKNDERYRGITRYANLFNVQNSIGIPLFYKGKLKALLAIEYVKEKTIPSDEDLNFFRILGNQIGIAFNQIQLYQDTKKAAQREKLLREIVSEISSTLDSNKIRKILVTKLGEALHSDMDIIYVRDSQTGKFLPVDEYSLHLSSDEIQSPVGTNIIEDYGWNKYIQNNKRPEVIYSDIEALKRDYILHGTKTEEFLTKYQIKSMIAIPIIYAKTFLGFLVLNFIKSSRTFEQEDINLVQVVAHQAAIALYQANLYVQAQEASRAKSEFIANMSHEIKTPLNIIIGFSDILSNSQVEPNKQMNYLENINKSGRHLLELTNDIINISKIESGNFKLDCENIDSKQLIEEAVESIKLIAESKNIIINTNTTSANINGDKKMLTQILYNLLTNAIKFTPENGHIEIQSELDNNNLIVSIEDTGIGIGKNNQSMIFENFRQVDSSYEKAQQGAGLGLAITKKLVELHKGSIHVKSSEGEGSRFWFILPNARRMK